MVPRLSANCLASSIDFEGLAVAIDHVLVTGPLHAGFLRLEC